MVFFTEVTVPSGAPKQLSRCVNPNQWKTRRLESNFRFWWKELEDQFILFSDVDDEGAFLVPALDARSQGLNIKDRRNGVGKPVFKLALLEVDSCILFVQLIYLFVVFLLKCCNGFSLKPTRPMCDGRLLASSFFYRRQASRGARFRCCLYIVLSF